MDYECINPEFREWISLVTESSAEEIAALDFGEVGYTEMCECRVHWNCCPSCRHEFPRFPVIAQQAGPSYEKSFASDLALLRDNFQAKRDFLLKSDGEDVYLRLIVELADAEWDVHDDLRRVLMVLQNLYQGREIEYDPYKKEILSKCRKFVSSLDPDVQRFVVSTTLCFELLRPMWEKVGLSPRFDVRPQEQIEAELAEGALTIEGEAGSSGERDGIEASAVNLSDKLRAAIAESGLEPRVLWELIEAAALASVFGGAASGIESLIERKFRELDDDVDSLKAAQMEMFRRIPETGARSASGYELEITARIGSPIYAKLNETTKQLLRQAEFQYEVNGHEQDFFHGPTLAMALAYETELNIRVVWPILNDLLVSGVETYGSSQRPLIKEKRINEQALTTGTIAWYLRKDLEFSSKVRARGFDVEAIIDDAYVVTRSRDRAAHHPVCGRAIADDLRQRILRPDGILGRLHPAIGSK